jgi:hypothetical protein
MFPPSLARVLSDGGTAVKTKQKKKKKNTKNIKTI